MLLTRLKDRFLSWRARALARRRCSVFELQIFSALPKRGQVTFSVSPIPTQVRLTCVSDLRDSLAMMHIASKSGHSIHLPITSLGTTRNIFTMQCGLARQVHLKRQKLKQNYSRHCRMAMRSTENLRWATSYTVAM